MGNIEREFPTLGLEKTCTGPWHLCINTLKSESTASLTLWAQRAQRAPRNAVDLPLVVDMTCWYSLETSFHEESKYEIVILILSNFCESVYVRSQTAKYYGEP